MAMSPETELLLTRWLADGAKLERRLDKLPDGDLTTVEELLVAMGQLTGQARERRAEGKGKGREL